MSHTPWLIVGLGNPGRDYVMNRHNIGFMALDALADKYGIGGDKKLFQSIVRSAVIDGKNVFLQKPQTFMNLSGDAVGAAARFYKIPVDNIIVIHDELDIPAKKIKVKQGGGAAGHNGLKSIDQHAGNNYWRVRLGIGRPNEKGDVSNYVLGDFNAEEQDWVSDLLAELVAHFPLILQGQATKFASHMTKKETEEVETKNGL
jgi:PTH1 family peptidyl-tRNA hydrolase